MCVVMTEIQRNIEENSFSNRPAINRDLAAGYAQAKLVWERLRQRHYANCAQCQTDELVGERGGAVSR